MTALLSYGTVKAGVTRTHQGWRLHLKGETLTNEMGLSVGNSRTDTLSGHCSPTPIYGHPLVDRSFRVGEGRKW
jgi:iron complex outermembrane recepter protein